MTRRDCTAKRWAIVSLPSLLLCTLYGPPAEADGVFAEPDYTQRVYGYTGVASTEQRNPLGDGTDPLSTLPADPLTGGTDTWQYEPTGTPMVDSGGYEIRITKQ